MYSRRKVKTLFIASFAGLLLLEAVIGVWWWLAHRSATSATTKTSLNVVEEVRKIMILPDEEPQVAEVANSEALKNQPFFKPAQNGDKVLFFIEAKKALLYRPSTHQIVDYAPLIPTDAASPTPTTSP
jgi:hypothetical protein